MRLAALLIAALLLTSCRSAPTKARKIMAPVTKKAQAVRVIAERQTQSLTRLKSSVVDAAEIAKKLDTERPDGDTARLILALRVAASETDALRGSNDELRLTISGLEVEIATSQDKFAAKIAGAETWKTWAWRWFGAFAGLALAVAAVVYFRHSLPFLKLL